MTDEFLSQYQIEKYRDCVCVIKSDLYVDDLESLKEVFDLCAQSDVSIRFTQNDRNNDITYECLYQFHMSRYETVCTEILPK